MVEAVNTLPGMGEITIAWSGDDRVLLVAAGEIDAADTGALDDLAASLHPLSAADVHLDATSLRFVDAAGLRALHRLATQLTGRGGSVTASGLGPVAASMWQAVAPVPCRPHPSPDVRARRRAA